MPASPYGRAMRARAAAFKEIREQAACIADESELLRGWPMHSDSWVSDCAVALDAQIDSYEQIGAHPTVVANLRKFRKNITAKSVASAIRTLEGMVPADFIKRLHIYLACAGDVPAQARVAAMSARGHQAGGPHAYWCLATALGLLTSTEGSMDAYFDEGARILLEIDKTRQVMKSIQAGLDAAAKGEPEPADEDEEDNPDQHESDWAAVLAAIEEDRGEIVRAGTRGPRIAALHKPKLTAVAVVPALPIAPTSHRREIARGFEGIAGKKVPLVQRPDLGAVRSRLISDFPWATEVVDRMLRDLASSSVVRIRPTLLLGTPGGGKSTFARAFFRSLGLPATTVLLGGAAESAVMGTSAQWSSARPSDALQQIARHRVANPGIVLDEIDKAKSSQNGSAMDALLPFLERETARNLRDPALEVEVNLEWVNWIATANDLSAVPGPLRDRLRVIRMPEPGPGLIGDLVRRIVQNIADERDLDRAFLPSLGQDEVENIDRAWREGNELSLRQLRSIVEAVVDFNEQHHAEQLN